MVIEERILSVSPGDEWKACFQGVNLGEELDETFAPVTAQHFRLNITEAIDGPTISEFRLFAPEGRN